MDRFAETPSLIIALPVKPFAENRMKNPERRIKTEAISFCDILHGLKPTAS